MRHAGVPAAEIEALTRPGVEPALRGFLSGSARSWRAAAPCRFAWPRSTRRPGKTAARWTSSSARPTRGRGDCWARWRRIPTSRGCKGLPRYERLLRETGLRPPEMALLMAPDLAR